ncbi:hypothetical protein [Denitrobaculum tricleocarpae]|uniref:Uncharacterized protein n=1 Tax=Denitrobaculum tricleocarpae TaxID=2591009 RepID=A0A545TPH3_9PROT|nr:hypothetical protein [Denitrobaculum tricleocarpae]TQV79114.1 hypothetical protein FKG95_15715 [Denitrobaculum tricleocarpae]
MHLKRHQTHVPGFLRGCLFGGLACLVGLASDAATGAQQSKDAASDPQRVTIEISDADCRLLTRHQPDADVAFQPGVDARGRPVAPADLNGGGQAGFSRLETPKRIVIPIEVDLFERFGVPANADLFKADAQVGQVIYDDGKLFYNGQRLADGASDELLLLCKKALKAETVSGD